MLRDAWRLSIGTLTAIPVAPPALVDRRRAGTAMVIAPLAALPLGIAVALVTVVGHELSMPPLVTALLALGAAIAGNRAFHLDGLCDTVDGMAASYDRERSLAVMKTGTSGPAGVVAVVLTVGLQAAGLASMFRMASWGQVAVLAAVVVCASRCALVVCCSHGVPSARPSGLGDPYTRTVRGPVVAATWTVVVGVVAALGSWAGLPWWRGALAAVLGLGAAVVVVARAIHRLGGVTGDVFGAAIELTLVTMLVALS